MARKAQSPIRSAAAWARSSLSQQKAHERVLEVIHAKREHPDWSLARAAKEFGSTPRTVRKYAGDIVRRDAGGRYVVSASDRLFRRVHFYEPKGRVTVGVVGSRKAAEIARYMGDVARALKSRDFTSLRKYRGKSVREKKVGYPYIIDQAVLDRLDAAGEISFENLYARVG
jgi:hypothetical protein